MYFIGVLAKEDFQFAPYYYGPYSSIVADQIGALCEAGFVSEQADMVGSFGELRRFDYELTKAGRKISDMRSEGLADYKEALGRINSHPLSNDPKLLSIAAKVHFIVHERGNAPLSTIRERARQLGWELNSNQVDRVVNYFCLLYTSPSPRYRTRSRMPSSA